MKDTLVKKIITMEWEMFQNVPNIGGKATCQNNYKTFNIMRLSQTVSWSEATLASYLEDLLQAKAQERNLLTEKYARMMKFTAPLEYAKIQHLLEPLSKEALLLIDETVKIHLDWTKEINLKFPHIRRHGRPTASSGNTLQMTSVETYLRGELATYSLRTLKLYYQNTLEQKNNHINGAQLVLAATMQQYGFASLDEANKALS